MMVQTAMAQQPKWGIHNSIVDYQQLTTSSLPTSPAPDYTQNALWDFNGNLVLYAADGVIYDKTGGVVLDMSLEANVLYHPYFSYGSHILAGFTEFIFVPVPGTCNKYYGITTYTNGNFGGSYYVEDVVWCKIDMGLNNGLGGAEVIGANGLKLARLEIACEDRGPENERSQLPRFYQMHLEMSSELSDGSRYLFASSRTCVSVLKLTGSGLSFLDGYQLSNHHFMDNLRSEMELYEKGDNRYEVVLPRYGMWGYNDVTDWSGLTVFEFDMSNPTSPGITKYDLNFPVDDGYGRLPKGLEYSEDGKVLYATVMTVGQNSSGTFVKRSGEAIYYFTRSGTNMSFPNQWNVIPVMYGGSPVDFGQGMIEKGADGSLLIAGSKRMGWLEDNNDPGSMFMENGQSISNQLSEAPLYKDYTNPSDLDILLREEYLLIDQVDGEAYDTWVPVADLFPQSITVCSFPTVLHVPSDAQVVFYPTGSGNQAPVGSPPYVLVDQPGTLYFTYNPGRTCETTEEVVLVEDTSPYCEAGFSYTVGSGNSIQVSAYCKLVDPTISHSYSLYYYNFSTGLWQYESNCTGTTCTLQPQQTGRYRIDHTVISSASPCGNSVRTEYLIIN